MKVAALGLIRSLRQGVWAAAFLPLLLAGCITIPGMYAGISSPENAYPGGAETEDVLARADIRIINPQTVAELDAVRERTEAQALESRRKASVALQPKDYIVGPQDALRVTVWNHPELTNPGSTANELSGRLVSAQGTFFYPYIGEVQAAGRTLDEIRVDMSARLTKYLRDPQVEVAVMAYRSKRVMVLGEVNKPGVQPLTDVPLRVVDSISQAEGLTEKADLYAATLTRANKTLPLDLNALLYKGDASQNLQLTQGDILNIPTQRYGKIFVMGEVKRPQSLLMPRGRFTLAEALSDSGGIDQLYANASQVYVIRATNDDRPQIWHLNASSPEAMVLADRFDLQPRDVVYVDPTNAVRFGRVVNAILPSAIFLQRVETTSLR